MAKWFKGLLWIAGILVVIAGILRATVLDAWRVPDDPILAAAVAPTMAGGDMILLLTRGEAGFGELVRCTDPEDPTRFVVGRIAGIGGDIVETTGSALMVNGRDYPSESACPKATFTVAHPSSGSEVELSCSVVSMGGGWHYRGIAAKASHPAKTRTLVGAGMLFLLSDDREFHDDSRDFGAIPRETCKERPVARLWGKAGWSDESRRLSYLH
jgi:signal peptidase I